MHQAALGAFGEITFPTLLFVGFLSRPAAFGLFFVNIRFMFNGDRLAFVKGYKLKGSEQQAELPLEQPPALPAV